MKKAIVASSFAAAAAGLILAGSAIGEPEQANFKVIHADELARLIAANDPKLAIYDANTPDFRAKQGIISGAKVLSSFDHYDVGKELPAAKDAKLVFYCAGTR